MGVSSTFESFCSSLRMDTDTVATIRRRYHSIVGLINEAYWNSSSESPMVYMLALTDAEPRSRPATLTF